jgi:integrase
VAEEWCAARVQCGKALLLTATEQRERVRLLLGELLECPIASFTPKEAAARYAAYVVTPGARTGRPPSAATHRHGLELCRFLWDWAMRRGYVATNPWKDVLPVGRPNKGKPQLRPSEAARLIAACEQDQSSMATAVRLLLELGLRASEALSVEARDVDSGVLFVQGSKSAAARRRIELPLGLREQMERMAAGCVPTERLFGACRRTLLTHVKRLCRIAGVPVVGCHALRGTHASLAVLGGASVQSVAQVLGHARTAITSAHYIAPDAALAARVGTVRASLDRVSIVPQSFHQPV